MKSRTIVFSLIVHVGLATALLLGAERKERRKATAITMGEEAKKEKPKAPDKPKPIVEKPHPPKAAPKMVTETARPAAPTPAPARSAAPAPVDTGLTLGDADGPGLDVGGPAKPANAPVKVTKNDAPAPVRPKSVPGPKKKDDVDTEEPCNEDPTRPEPISKTEIEYTQAARAAGVEGRLVIRVTVGRDGGVSKAEVVSGVDAQLDAAAIAAVERWRFKPATRCGKPMFGGVYTLARRFELGD